MQDLNDLYYFAQVVEHGGFAPAGRALGIPKSKLSRRIALLEERLGVRLLQRSTRRFSVTEIGQDYYGHCKAMLVEAEAAQEAIELTRAEPRGVVRLTCPVALLHARVGDDARRLHGRAPARDRPPGSDEPARGRDRRRHRRRDPRAPATARGQRPGDEGTGRAQWCLVASPALVGRPRATHGAGGLEWPAQCRSRSAPR